jgi:MSHA biogenesis protein MshQ
MRYGRLRLDDAFGPESTFLPVKFYTEYWTGSYWAKNINDNCTRILRSAITYPAGNILNPANLTVPLTGGSTTGQYLSTTTTATEIGFTNGDALHRFSMPTGAATGSFNVNVDLSSYPWLRFDWNQDGNYSDTSLPAARFGFGSYRGHDRIIYWREKFN